MYIATPDRTKNINWLGEAPVEALAAQIAAAHGPSGPNDEYVFRLAAAMRQVRPPNYGNLPVRYNMCRCEIRLMPLSASTISAPQSSFTWVCSVNSMLEAHAGGTLLLM